MMDKSPKLERQDLVTKMPFMSYFKSISQQNSVDAEMQEKLRISKEENKVQSSETDDELGLNHNFALHLPDERPS